MTGLSELMKDTGFRRPFLLSAAAAAVWVLFAAFIWAEDSSERAAGLDIASAGGVLDCAMQFRALPRTRSIRADAPGEPIGALSEIIDALGLRDRLRQLQSNPSGITAQIDKMYGNELGELLSSLENRSLAVKTAEIRAMPSEGKKLLSVTLMLEPAR